MKNRSLRRIACLGGVGLSLASFASAQHFSLIDRAKDLTSTVGARKQKKKIQATSRTFVRHNSVGGNTSRSFFQEGWFYEEHVSLQQVGVNGRGNDYQFEMDFRVTNEDRVDPDTFLLQNFAYREWNERWLLEVGDIFHEFNHLTLNRNIKGVGFTRFPNYGEKWKTTFLVGVDKSRWRDLFVDTPRESLTRWVMGMRVEREFRNKRDQVGFNIVTAKDSATSAPNNPGLIAADSKVLSMDVRSKLNKNWRASGVFAVSNNSPNRTVGPQDRWGSAINVDFQYDSDNRKVYGRTRFQSTDPDFLSLEGSPVPDFQKFDTAWRYAPSDLWEFQGKWETFRNNLDGQIAAGTTETEVPSLGVTFRHPTLPLRLDLRAEDREIDNPGAAPDQEIQDVTIRAENRFGQVRAVLDYQTREDELPGRAIQTIESDQVTLSLDSRVRRSNGVQLIPAISYQTRQQDNLTVANVEDQIDTFTLRLGMILPSKKSIRFAYRNSDREDGANLSDSESTGYEFNFNMPVGNRAGDQLSFRLLRNENDFQIAGNDFDETSTQLSYTHRF